MARHPTPRAHLLVACLAAWSTAGCATAYGPRGLTGGYADDRIDDTHYRVTFNGNGHASKERVWNFWLYRCAELTLEKGYAFFDLEFKDKDKRQGLIEQVGAEARLAAARAGREASPFVPAGFIYIPGSTITTWNSSAVVVMHATVPSGAMLLSAKRVQELLGPYVRSNGDAQPPERKALFRGALMKLGPDQVPVQVVPEGARVGFLDRRRVMGGLADARAASERVRAAADKLQARLDAGKADLDRLRKVQAAETDPARRSKLEASLAAKKRDHQELLTRLKAELNQIRERELKTVTDRLDVIVEQVRSANQLDTVTQEDVGGLWDLDVTASVIKAYDAAYPVAPKT